MLLLAPQTPLLFMGQEWAASAPFQFFTDHSGELGEIVRAGRAREFEGFPDFSDAERRASIPDPQDLETFRRSRLDWPERERGPHLRTLHLYEDLLDARKTIGPPAGGAPSPEIRAIDPDTLLLRRVEAQGATIIVIARLRGAGEAMLDPAHHPGPWRVLLQTEHPRYASDSMPIAFESDPSGIRVRFARPGAVIATTRAES